MNFRIAYKPHARLQTVNQHGQGNGAGKRGLRSKDFFGREWKTDWARKNPRPIWVEESWQIIFPPAFAPF
jgi:hypothetical protein